MNHGIYVCSSKGRNKIPNRITIYNVTEEKFNRLLQVNIHAKSSKAIYNEYNIIYILADDTLKNLSDEMKRTLSYSQKCNGFTGYTYMHFEDEVFPGKCKYCNGRFELEMKKWAEFNKSIAGLPFSETIKKRVEFVKMLENQGFL